jgi:transcription initiation factor TFIIB
MEKPWLILKKSITAQRVKAMKTPTNFALHLSAFVNQLVLSSKTQERAQMILNAAEQTGLTTRMAPKSLIAAALYIAGILEEERRTQKAIGQVVGVSASTIQKQYRELVHGLGIRSG